MKNINRFYIVGGASAVGFFFGNSMGLAFGGGAINLGVTLGVIFGVFAFISTWKRATNPQFSPINQSTTTSDETPKTAPVDEIESGVAAEFNYSLGSLFDSLQALILWLRDTLCKLWNVEMNLIAVIGLMPTVKKFPWLLLLLALLLLATVFPIGVFYVLAAIAALTKSPKLANDFRV